MVNFYITLSLFSAVDGKFRALANSLDNPSAVKGNRSASLKPRL